MEGFDLSLLEDCDNVYRFTAVANVDKVKPLLVDFCRFMPEECFFILEFYQDDILLSRPSGSSQRPVPAVYYSPYMPTAYILNTVKPYFERLIHDGFVGFGLANNRKGIELFYSEEKILTFFTDNHLRLTDFLAHHDIPYNDNLFLPSEFGHDHLSLFGFPCELLPQSLSSLKNSDLDSTLFCNDLTEILDMYQVEEGLSFFLTRKEQEKIAQLIKHQLPHHELTDVEFGGLLLDWSDFVSECENGFEGDLWEYKQGLKIRDLIQLVIEVSDHDLAEKLNTIIEEPDCNFKKILIDQCRRFDPPEELNLPNERFWYHGVVAKQGYDLRRDLIRHGWFHNPS
jgi:hypothetical protein